MLNFRLKRIEKSARIKWDPRSRGREPARMWRLGRNARESYRGWWGPRPWPVSTTTTTRDTRGLDGQCAACRRWWAVCSYMPQWFGQCAAVWHVGDCGQCVQCGLWAVCAAFPGAASACCCSSRLLHTASSPWSTPILLRLPQQIAALCLRANDLLAHVLSPWLLCLLFGTLDTCMSLSHPDKQ